jgi:hypothetical protein
MLDVTVDVLTSPSTVSFLSSFTGEFLSDFFVGLHKFDVKELLIRTVCSAKNAEGSSRKETDVETFGMGPFP